MKSPIEQRIIDGTCYWDQIGPRWYRLIDRVSQDVLGHYKQAFEVAGRWHCVINSTGSRAVFPTQSEAREFIELYARGYYESLEHALASWR